MELLLLGARVLLSLPPPHPPHPPCPSLPRPLFPHPLPPPWRLGVPGASALALPWVNILSFVRPAVELVTTELPSVLVEESLFLFPLASCRRQDCLLHTWRYPSLRFAHSCKRSLLFRVSPAFFIRSHWCLLRPFLNLVSHFGGASSSSISITSSIGDACCNSSSSTSRSDQPSTSSAGPVDSSSEPVLLESSIPYASWPYQRPCCRWDLHPSCVRHNPNCHLGQVHMAR